MNEEPAPLSERPPQGRRWTMLIIIVLVIGAVLAMNFSRRFERSSAVRADTAEMAQWRVAVTAPKQAAADQRLVLPATIRAYTEAAIYARVDGYLKRRHVDIGSRVRAGQILAELDTPEADQQLRQARADLASAQANARLAELTARRYAELLQKNFVSKQDADATASAAQARNAEARAAQFNVRRLEDIQGFKRVLAPFDGVITARSANLGMLVDSGSGGGSAKALFSMAAADRLRVQVNLPQTYSRLIKPGLSGEFTIAEFPDQRFQGRLVRTADTIDLSTRTLLIEFEMDNPTGLLLAGAHAQAQLNIPTSGNSFLLPINTLLFRPEGVRIATVQADGKALLVPITLGRDFGREVEITAGLTGKESVIVDPPDSLLSGTAVKIAQPPPGKP